MPNKGARYSSEYLSKEQMRSALLSLAGAFRDLLGEHEIVAMYGWATKIHDDLHWQPMKDDTRWLQHLIEESIDQRIVIPGESDFLFEVPEKRLELKFCHESDIHLDGSDDELLHQFMNTEPFSRMHWYTQNEVEKMMS
jgi:hypothetical protein